MPTPIYHPRDLNQKSHPRITVSQGISILLTPNSILSWSSCEVAAYRCYA